MKRRSLGIPVAIIAAALALGGCDPFSGVVAVVEREPPPDTANRGSPADPVAMPASESAPVAPMVPVTGLDVSALAERVRPVVVNITTTQKAAVLPQGLQIFGPHGFFSGGPPDQERRAPERIGLGSGIIIDPAGYVVTNEHVVEGASTVRVRLADEREFDAAVVGRDPKLDLALLKLDGASDLPAAALGSSAPLRVGEPVMAVGNPFGLGHTVTTGIVSAKARAIGLGPYDDFIQTDASINPGNSGGPLFNLAGEVIGINTAIRAGANGIGFAIPVDALKGVLPQLREKGYVERGRIGIAFQPVTLDLARALRLDAPRGALVAEVDPNGPAPRAGIRPGDVIIAVDGTPILHAEDLPRHVAGHLPGSDLAITVLRDGNRLDLTARLDALDEERAQAMQEPHAPERNIPAGKLGIRVSNAEEGRGVRVYMILPQAEVGDLQEGDIIVDVAGKPVRTTDDLSAVLQQVAPGSTALVKVRRGDITRFAAVPIPPR